VGSDPETDIAVLRIDLPDLPAITIGRSEDLRVGDVVLAIGNPFGVGQTVTMGIVSATGRSDLGINTFENFIQTDAAINPGNSGGALVNPSGELVGINTAIYSGSGGSVGIGFAIPVSLATGVMSEILRQGHVTRGWLGLEIQDVSADLVATLGLDRAEGVVVTGVLRDGPAHRAGVEPGDVLLGIGGRPMRDRRAVLEAISGARPGTATQLTLLRQGRPLSVEAQVAQRPAAAQR
jgi:S1-C subfamily serine protease